MKKIEFTRKLDAFQHITLTIHDEERFKQLCEQHIAEEETLNYWDVEDMDKSVVSMRFGDIDWVDGDNDFNEKMGKIGISTGYED
jgi:hypothetical protein